MQAPGVTDRFASHSRVFVHRRLRAMGITASLSLLLALLLFVCTMRCTVATAARTTTINGQDMLKQRVKSMFYHGYDSYMRYAFPLDELKPLTCGGMDTWGSYCLTLIDSLDALVIFGNASEFEKAIYIVRDRVTFDADINVSVFETNIRILGGLISAHCLIADEDGPAMLDPLRSRYDGFLLRMARDVGDRLLAAFETPTGMPYGTVNLRNGIPDNETPITCAACVGTFSVEFGALSRLSGDDKYHRAAKGAAKALYGRRTKLGLYGNHINVLTGEWTHLDASIGPSVDSLYEYFAKGAYLFRDPEYHTMFGDSYAGAMQSLRTGPWYVSVNMHSGQVSLPWFTALSAFWPGLQVLHGDVGTAIESVRAYYGVWKEYGFVPEVLNLQNNFVPQGQGHYPLRPELIESTMYAYRATKDPLWLEAGRDYVASLRQTKTACGHAVVSDVRNHRLSDRMESFFLSETIKYLYLLLDEDNFVHTGNYVFNTEGHIIPADYLYRLENDEESTLWRHQEDTMDAFLEDARMRALKRAGAKEEEQRAAEKKRRIAELRRLYEEDFDRRRNSGKGVQGNGEPALEPAWKSDPLYVEMLTSLLKSLRTKEQLENFGAGAVSRETDGDAEDPDDVAAQPDSADSAKEKKAMDAKSESESESESERVRQHRPTDWKGCRRLRFEDTFSVFTGDIAEAVDGLQWRSTHSPTNARAIERPDVCASKKLGMWIYRVCYGFYIRQYMQKETDGKWLGFFMTRDLVRDAFLSDVYDVLDGHSVVERNGPLGPTVVQHFAQGTWCPEIMASRSSTVKYICSEGGSARIVSIAEPSMCVYEFVVETPVVCSQTRRPRDERTLMEG